MSSQPQVFVPTPESGRVAQDYLLSTLPAARADMSPGEFRAELRKTMENDSALTLHQVAQALGVTRQRVYTLVGKLNRPNCVHGPHPAPRRDEARRKMVALVTKVRAGESAERAAKELGVSLSAAMVLGFRTKKFRAPHGTRLRAVGDEGVPPCNCWRCRRVAGIALPRGPRTGAARQAAVLDWLAWADPDTGEGLRQAEIGKLTGVGQGLVSRIARAAE